MGQAVADLPELLNMPPAGSLAGTDDLLAQLAGDEIDRLLADAGEERTSAPNLPASNSPVVAHSVPSVTVATPPVAEPASPAVNVGESTSDDLDALLSEIEKGDASPALPSAESAATSSMPHAPAVGPPSDVIVSSPEPASPDNGLPAPTEPVMSVAERDALRLSDLSEETAAAEAHDAEAHEVAKADPLVIDMTPDAGPRRAGIVIRMLELLNAPADAVPDALRDVLGKAAIVTIVNSVAVLIYVLFVRH